MAYGYDEQEYRPLRGRVLAIGGLKEKTMAAYRSGIKTVILPKENEKDLQEIDQTVRAGLRFVPVETVDAVFAEALEYPDLAERSEELPALFTSVETGRENQLIRQ